MKRQWLLLLFPVVLVGVLLALQYFSKNRGTREVAPTESEVALSKLEIATNAPKDEIPKTGPAAQKNMAPEVVEKISTTLEKYIKDNPKAGDISDAYYNLGNLYYESGQYEKAIEPLRIAVAQRPDDSDAHYTLGNAYDKLKRYPEAAKEFEAMTRIEPKNETVFYNLANAYFYQKKYQEASEQYKKALSLNAKNAAAHYGNGMAYLNLKKNKDALASLQQAVNLDPNNADAHYFLGLLKLESGDRKGAAEQQNYLKKIKAEYADDIGKKLNR
ncbi:MAG: tetratricopeptide repeat protein [Acidobacteriota bacterium]